MEGFICIQTFLSTLFKFSGDIEPDDIRVSYLQFEAIAIIRDFPIKGKVCETQIVVNTI